jgi:hypothetical protein
VEVGIFYLTLDHSWCDFVAFNSSCCAYLLLDFTHALIRYSQFSLLNIVFLLFILVDADFLLLSLVIGVYLDYGHRWLFSTF